MMNTEPNREDALTLELLNAVQKRSDVSQRGLARQLGVALGLANSYLKRCVRKGLIKITDAPANRYLYYLTPKGFAEKSRLTALYLSYSFSFYREASESCAEVVMRSRDNGWQRLVLCGVSDLAEIATLRAMEQGLEIVAFYDPTTERRTFLHRPVVDHLALSNAYDACVLTDLGAPQAMYDFLVGVIDPARVLVPSILRLEHAAAVG
jgi:DNA-binding MarR family transcriptional regulator